jgi:hypothetical protein
MTHPFGGPLLRAGTRDEPVEMLESMIGSSLLSEVQTACHRV